MMSRFLCASTLAMLIVAELLAQSTPTQLGEFELLAQIPSEFGWAEGPAYDGNGGIWFSHLGGPWAPPGIATSIYRYDLATGELELKLEDTGGANGLLFDSDGNLFAAHGDDQQVTRRPISDLNDAIVIADSFQGSPFVAPNDLVIDRDGGLYFTDPAFVPDQNSVFYLSADQELSRVARGLFFANGLALSPDGNTLYVAETGGGRITAFDVLENGSVANQRVFASRPRTDGRAFNPDGMTIDRFGNLYVADIALSAGPDTFDPALPGPKVRVWNELGEEVFAFDTPDKAAANLLFSPLDDDYLYITATDSLWRVPIEFSSVCTPVSNLLGDFDGDGTVGFSDFLVLSQSFGNAGSYVDGDADCDGEVGFADFLILSENFGASALDVANVPESSTMVGFGPALLCLLWLRRKTHATR